MRTLILMRHAKSSWAESGMDDHDRPLNDRGMAAAPVMAQWLAARGLRPDIILCSSSRRTRQTVERMREAVPGLPAAKSLMQLYHGDPAAILAEVRRLPDKDETVLLVLHEPGISEAAMLLGGGGAGDDSHLALVQFPTAAVAVFETEVQSWSGLGWGLARLVAFARPRDLMG